MIGVLEGMSGEKMSELENTGYLELDDQRCLPKEEREYSGQSRASPRAERRPQCV